MHSGNGRSIGDAMVDGFSKMYYSLTENSRIDTIESKYNGMRNALSENRDRMRPDAINQCKRYISLTSDLLYRRKNAKQIAEQRKKEEKRKEEERRRAEEREYEKQERERKKLLEEKRRAEAKEREEQQRIHKQFIDQQRKLMSAKLRYAVLQRDGFRCQLCGATKGNGVVLHVDHIIPVSKGGLTEMSNLRTLCERCNLGKGDSIEEIQRTDSQANNELNGPNEAAPEKEKQKIINEVNEVSSDPIIFQTTEPIQQNTVSIQDDPDVYSVALQVLRENRRKYVDKTQHGGNLYFYDKDMAALIKSKGYTVYFTKSGTKGTNYKAAWYVRQRRKNTN